MKFTLTIDCDNAAFEEDGIENELAHILYDVRRSVRDGQTTGTCRDSNGNTVGQFHLADEADDTDDTVTWPANHWEGVPSCPKCQSDLLRCGDTGRIYCSATLCNWEAPE